MGIEKKLTGKELEKAIEKQKEIAMEYANFAISLINTRSGDHEFKNGEVVIKIEYRSYPGEDFVDVMNIYCNNKPLLTYREENRGLKSIELYNPNKEGQDLLRELFTIKYEAEKRVEKEVNEKKEEELRKQFGLE